MARETSGITATALVGSRQPTPLVGGGIIKDQNIFEGKGGATQEAAANSAWGGAKSKTKGGGSGGRKTATSNEWSADKTSAEATNIDTQRPAMGENPWTFGGDALDNLFMLSDFEQQYGPRGFNAMTDDHLSMLTAFAGMISKGQTDFKGGGAAVMQTTMQAIATSYAARSSSNKQTDGTVPESSGGTQSGYTAEEHYAEMTSEGEPGGIPISADVDPLSNIVNESLTDTTSAGSGGGGADHMAAITDEGTTGDSEKVVNAPSGPTDAEMNRRATLVKKFLSSPAGRGAFGDWMSTQGGMGVPGNSIGDAVI